MIDELIWMNERPQNTELDYNIPLQHIIYNTKINVYIMIPEQFASPLTSDHDEVLTNCVREIKCILRRLEMQYVILESVYLMNREMFNQPISRAYTATAWRCQHNLFLTLKRYRRFPERDHTYELPIEYYYHRFMYPHQMHFQYEQHMLRAYQDDDDD